MDWNNNDENATKADTIIRLDFCKDCQCMRKGKRFEALNLLIYLFV